MGCKYKVKESLVEYKLYNLLNMSRILIVKIRYLKII